MNQTSNRITIEHIVIKFHFFYLYVFLYSCFRNTLWFVDDLTEIEAVILKYMVIGGFLWFIGANFFLYQKKYKSGWGRKDYLSPYVLSASIITIALLEFFVFD